MYQQILYPTDGSAGAKAAADHVRELASAFDATVHVLYVVDTRQVGFGMTGEHITGAEPGLSGGHIEGGDPGMEGERSDPDETRSELLSQSKERVLAAADQFEGVETVTAIEEGSPHSVILEYIDENDIDLVVMGTHGRTGVERYLLGSVAEKVVRMADPPVVTVRAGEEE